MMLPALYLCIQMEYFTSMCEDQVDCVTSKFHALQPFLASDGRTANKAVQSGTVLENTQAFVSFSK